MRERDARVVFLVVLLACAVLVTLAQTHMAWGWP